MNRIEREGATFDAIKNNKWDEAIEHASHLPPNEDIWQRMPSTSPMPDEAVHKVLDVLQHPHGQHKKSIPTFLYEYMHNLPDHASPEILNHVGKVFNEHNLGDWRGEQNIINHPNYKPDADTQALNDAAKFWSSYERKVDPRHFATIKSMYTGKPEKIKDHRGGIGISDPMLHLIPSLHQYAKVMQDKILKDEYIKKRYFNGKPHIKLYRGVNGHYGKAIHDAAQFNQEKNEVKDKKFILPTAHLSSWTTDPEIASGFAWMRNEIPDAPANKGVVMSQWLPVDSILHSGLHDVVLGQDHPHKDESEIIVGHPKGKMKIGTGDMRFQNSTSDYGDVVKPNLTKTEEMLYKSGKKMAAAATALALIGAPQLPPSEVDDSMPIAISIEQTKPILAIKHSSKILENPDLAPIKMIESSNGKNTAHKLIESGPHAGTVAYGQYGLMPMQIIDTLHNDKHLGAKYPEIVNLDYKKDQDQIFQELLDHPELEKAIANSHWKRLGNRFDGDTNKMAYAWLHGIDGTIKASDDDIANHPYVQKYNKFKKMIELEDPKQEIKKSESSPDIHGLQKFIPLTGTNTDQYAIKLINDAMKAGQIHNLSNVGHFTHDSFIAGFDRNNSWLIKIEPNAKPAIASAKHGLQAIKEVAFYRAASEVFNLGSFTPKAILGEVEQNGKYHPAAAIKMYPDVYVPAVHQEKEKPGSIKGILEKYRRSGTLHKMAAMLYVLGDADAHGNNLMTNGTDIKMIDHGTSFADENFDPSTDKDIFIPYILRAGYIRENWDKNKKLENMPKIGDQHVRNELRHWILTLRPQDLLQILEKFYIDPKPSLNRLVILQKLAGQSEHPDEVINQLWVTGFHKGEQNGVN